MKSVFAFAIVCLLTITFSGCGEQGENNLATEGATADDFARYEEELAAVSGGDSYEDAEGADDAVAPAEEETE